MSTALTAAFLTLPSWAELPCQTDLDESVESFYHARCLPLRLDTAHVPGKFDE
jgi:hypothetical protein